MSLHPQRLRLEQLRACVASLPECLVLAAARRMLSQLGVQTGPWLLVFMGFVSLGNLFHSQTSR